MMRPVTLAVGRNIPDPPTPLQVSGAPGSPITLTWTDKTPTPTGLTVESTFEPKNEIGFRVERAPLSEGGVAGDYAEVGVGLANSASFTDTTTVAGRAYRYRVVAFNASDDPTLFGATASVDVTPASYFNSFVAMPTAYASGAISPATPQSVPADAPADVTFTITPDANYHVADVLVDGVSVGAVSTYTFENMSADHTIEAFFAADMHTITPSVAGDATLGDIWWDTPQQVQHGAMKTFAFVPKPGYRVAEVRVDGVPVSLPQYGGKAWDFYTFSDVTQDHTISVSFEVMDFTITPSVVGGGTISPSTPQTVNQGANSPTFTMTPNAGYHLTELRVDGVLVPTSATYTFTNVQANHTLQATFTSDRMMQVYRFFNLRNGSHFYTASAGERDMVSATWPTVWQYEGMAYEVNLDNSANVDPLFRFYNRVRETHFYTASASERDMVMATWPNIFTYEGIAYNVSAVSRPNTSPVYRFYNNRSLSHFYTISADERNAVMTKWPDIFTYEGEGFYIGH